MRFHKTYNGMVFDRSPQGIVFHEEGHEVTITWEQLYLIISLMVLKMKQGTESQLLGEILAMLQADEDEEE